MALKEPQSASVPETPAVAAAARVAIFGPVAHALPDGSRMELKPGAEFKVEFTAGVRRIVLVQGEAHFDVVKDAARDFIVAAGGLEVRAVGTAFSVDRRTAQVDVLVTEGRVDIDRIVATASPAPAAVEHRAIERRSTSTKTIATVDAGRRIVVETESAAAVSRPIVAVSIEEQRQRLAWRVPRLELSGTPLRDAIPVFNQYGRSQMALDPALGHIQLSGVLRADDTESLLLLLKNEFGIESRPREDGEIELRKP